MSRRPTLIALLHGPDQPGLVARVSTWIFDHGGNIIHADQHRDQEAEIFFQRVEWSNDAKDPEVEAAAFRAFAADLGMQARVCVSTHRTRVALMVSKYDHCFHDLVLRSKAGEFRGDMVCVLSNHANLERECTSYGIPFYHVPVEKHHKEEAERRQVEILREHGIELVVLARYMQVLTRRFLDDAAVPVINIHHSFLPAFAGGRPYHQAHSRGVKLIGATAHYVTEVLDDGPIIHQDVVRITHRHSVQDLVRKGRNLEQAVLSQAVLWHLDSRILVYGRKTVVFD